MRNLRKYTAIVVALAMVLSIMSFGVVFAAGESLTVTAVPDKTTAAPGDTVKVTLDVTSDGDSFTSGIIGFDLRFNTDVFDYQGVEFTYYDAGRQGMLSDWEALSGWNTNEAVPKFVFGTLSSFITPKSDPGYLAAGTVELKVKDGAPDGEQTLTVVGTGASNKDTDFITQNTVNGTVTIGQAAPPTEAPTEAPTAAPTEAPATEAPATQAPATEAPATEAPTAAPTEAPVVTQPPVSDTEFTITIPGKSVPENVKSLVVKSDIDSDDSIVIERDENGDFTKTLPKGKTYSVVEIRDENGDALPLDVVQSELTFSETDNNVVIVEKEGEDAFTVALKDDVKISAQADADVMGSIPEFTITVTTPVAGGEPTVEDVVYNDATKGDFDLRLVDDHNIMVIYKGVAADKYIKVERTISEFGATIKNPVPNQVMPSAEVSLPGHYTVDTAWYMITENGETPVTADSYEADYRTEYKAVITFKPEHELDTALENAKYYLNGTEVAASEGSVEYRYTTGGKASIGNSTFGTGGGSPATAAPTGTSEPVVTPPNNTGAQVFDDVPPTYWAYDYIMDLYNAGIVNGETANLYMPENNITRAEFTKIAVNVFGLEAASTTSQFSDVNASDWFAPYVIAATEAGLVNGISENEFAPNADITREQMATIIGRQMNMTSTAAMTYPDAASISDYAKEYVAGLTENGLLQGDETGNFRPQANAARSEASALLDRVYVLTRSEEVPEDVPETTEAPTAAPSNNSGFSTGTTATEAPTATAAPEETEAPDASSAPEASSTPASK